MSADQATKTGWWRVAGAPQAALAWIQGHPPRGSAYGGAGGLTHDGTYEMWDLQLSLPPVPGVLLGRIMVVTLAADGEGRTGIRVDAYVDWQPVKTAAEIIPASGRMVTITPVGNQAADHQLTVTDPAQIAQIAAAVNALPVSPPHGGMWCDLALPPGGGPRMQLTFRGSAGVTVVTAYQDMCGQVNAVTDGKTMPDLTGASTLIQQVMTIAGFHWSDYPAPGPTATAP